MNKVIITLLVALSGNLFGHDQVSLLVDDQELIVYQAAPLANPKGGDQFKGSNFIHPLKTPSGFTVTDSQPGDHPHHFGLWWPWKFIELEGRKILCWELQKGDGIVEAKEHQMTDEGLIATSVYIDRKAPDGPQVRLNEKTIITASDIVDQPATGYSLDLKISHQVAGDQPITINKYRYSGLGYRGTALWNKETSTILTSEGKARDSANFTTARWIRVEGTNGADGTAGVLLMSHPANHSFPEKIRTWNEHYNGAIFINFNPVMDAPWTFEPGQSYDRHYRIFVYDGTLSAEDSEAMWQKFSALNSS